MDRSEPTSPTSRNCVASEISKLLPPLGRIFRFLISTRCFQFIRLVPIRSGGGNEMREKGWKVKQIGATIKRLPRDSPSVES